MRLVDGRLLLTLGAGNGGLALAGGDIDLFLAATFRGRDQGTLFALGRDLGLHGQQDFLGRGQVLDFVAQHLHTPVQCGFVNSRHHLRIDDVTLFKSLVKL